MTPENNSNTKVSGLEVRASWPMIGVLISGYCLVKLTKKAIQISDQK